MFFGREGALSGTSAGRTSPADRFLPPRHGAELGAGAGLNKEGATVLSRAVLPDPAPADRAYQQQSSSFLAILAVGAIAAGFAAFEVILLAGAAFTVTARQQQRTLATIASVGATRSTLFRVLSSSGIVLGAIGGVLGIGVGIAGGTAFMALTGEGNATRYFGFHVPWLLLFGYRRFRGADRLALGPHAGAHRLQVRHRLRSTRSAQAAGAEHPSPRRRADPADPGRRVGLGGGVLFAAFLEAGRGTPYGHPLLWVPIVLLVAGPVLAQLGLVLCGPLLLRVVLGSCGARGIGARLASQDAARNPGRAVPALAAYDDDLCRGLRDVDDGLVGAEHGREITSTAAALGMVKARLAYQEYSDKGPGRVRTVSLHPSVRRDTIRSSVERRRVRTLASVHEPARTDRNSATCGAVAKPDAANRDLSRCPWSRPRTCAQASPGSAAVRRDRQRPDIARQPRRWRPTGGARTLPVGIFGSDHIWVGDTETWQ